MAEHTTPYIPRYDIYALTTRMSLDRNDVLRFGRAFREAARQYCERGWGSGAVIIGECRRGLSSGWLDNIQVQGHPMRVLCHSHLSHIPLDHMITSSLSHDEVRQVKQELGIEVLGAVGLIGSYDPSGPCLCGKIVPINHSDQCEHAQKAIRKILPTMSWRWRSS